MTDMIAVFGASLFGLGVVLYMLQKHIKYTGKA